MQTHIEHSGRGWKTSVTGTDLQNGCINIKIRYEDIKLCSSSQLKRDNRVEYTISNILCYNSILSTGITLMRKAAKSRKARIIPYMELEFTMIKLSPTDIKEISLCVDDTYIYTFENLFFRIKPNKNIKLYPVDALNSTGSVMYISVEIQKERLFDILMGVCEELDRGSITDNV